MAKTADKKQKPKGKGAGKKGTPAATGISVRARAGAHIRRIKAWSGLAFFVIAAGLSLKASVPLLQVGIRALVAGVVGYLLGWACGVMIWRQWLQAEQRAAEEIVRQRHDEEVERRQGGVIQDPRREQAAARPQKD